MGDVGLGGGGVSLKGKISERMIGREGGCWSGIIYLEMQKEKFQKRACRIRRVSSSFQLELNGIQTVHPLFTVDCFAPNLGQGSVEP